MRYFDSHVHSRNSHDAHSPVSDLAETAIRRGIAAFAVTDHCDIEYYLSWDQPKRVDASIAETRATAAQYADRVKILTGIEIGEGIWNMDHTEDILSRHAYDVVLGSIHAVRYRDMTEPFAKIDFSGVSDEDINGFMAQYFEDYAETVRTVPADVMTHLCNPLKYITGVYGKPVDLHRCEREINEILDMIIARDLALEVNTACLGGGYDAFMPEEWIVKLYHDRGGTLVTIGSDAHRADRIGAGLDRAVELLQKIGFSAYYYFENRKPAEVSL